MDPTLSVVIPTRNRLAYLQEAVASALGPGADREVIVVDDASDDGTSEWLRSVTDERVRPLTSTDHLERSAARNRGLELARADLVLFLDDDDRIRGAGADRVAAALQRKPKAVAAVGGARQFNENGHERRVAHPIVPFSRVIWPEVLMGWNRPPGQWLIRTGALREAGGWDETLIAAEDAELWLRLGYRGPVLFHPSVVLEKRVHTGHWRPSDLADVFSKIQVEFAGELSGGERRRAERAIAAGRDKYMGWKLFKESRCRAALPHYGRGLRRSRLLLTSPVVGPQQTAEMTKAVVGALLGRRGTEAARKVTAFLRDKVHRSTGGGDEDLTTVEGSARLTR